jgi:hypothetical protein
VEVQRCRQSVEMLVCRPQNPVRGRRGETASGRVAVITLGTLISASFSRWKAAPKVRLAGRV